VSGDPSFRELLVRVRAVDLAAFENQDLPFERLVEVLAPSRSLGRHPLFQVMLSFNTNAQVPFELPGLRVSEVEVPESGSAKFDLNFLLHALYGPDGGPAGIAGVIAYATDLFDHEMIEVLGRQFNRLLGQLIADPDQPISRIAVPEQAHRDTSPAGSETVRGLGPGRRRALATTQIPREGPINGTERDKAPSRAHSGR
jgi:non-ribosomal peptide synthetase component F